MTTATIQKWGNSQGIRLPRFILDEAQLGTNEAVKIEVAGGAIIIKKAEEKRKSIKELFEGYEGDCSCKEIDWGKPVGNEIW